MGAPERHARVPAVGAFGDGVPTGGYFSELTGQYAGSDSMSAIVVVNLRNPGASGTIISATNVGGWYLDIFGTNQIRFRMRDGGDVTQVASSPINTLTRGLHVLHLRKDPTDGYVYLNGSQVATAGCVGWTAGSPPRAVIGALAPAGTAPLVGNDLLAALIADTDLMDVGDVVASYEQVLANLKQGRDLRDGGLGFVPEWYWDARDWPGYGPWVDRVASFSVPVTGAPQLFEYPGKAVGA